MDEVGLHRKTRHDRLAGRYATQNPARLIGMEGCAKSRSSCGAIVEWCGKYPRGLGRTGVRASWTPILAAAMS